MSNFKEEFDRIRRQKALEILGEHEEIHTSTVDDTSAKIDAVVKPVVKFTFTSMILFCLLLSVSFNGLLWSIHEEAIDYRSSAEFQLYEFRKNPSHYSYRKKIIEDKNLVCGELGKLLK